MNGKYCAHTHTFLPENAHKRIKSAWVIICIENNYRVKIINKNIKEIKNEKKRNPIMELIFVHRNIKLTLFANILIYFIYVYRKMGLKSPKIKLI